MDLGGTLLLGLIAGATILLGIPVGRLRRPAPHVQLVLAAAAAGVLLFLLWDVLSAAWAPVDAALAGLRAGDTSWSDVAAYGLLFAAGITIGLLSLVGYERWMRRHAVASSGGRGAVPTVRNFPANRPATMVGAAAVPAGSRAGGAVPGAPSPRSAPASAPASVPASVPASGPTGLEAGGLSPRTLALLIAVGIGVHNFAEGLAIGQSAAAGDVALAGVLVVGFALHNATEGFGIVAPLAGDRDQDGTRRVPSWRFLLTLAVIGGGPTFLGTWVGHAYVNQFLSVAFLSLAAGSILYVVIQLITVAAKSRRPDLLAYGILAGLFAGFLTDGILIAAGV